MDTISHRRRTGVLAAVVAAVLPALALLGSVAAGSPAAAAGDAAADPLTIVHTASATLPPAVVAGPDGTTKITLGFGKDRPGHPTGTRTITVDATDLAGVASAVFLSPPCKHQEGAPANTAVCTVPHTKADGSDTVQFNLDAAPDVQGGPARTVRYTGSWGGVAAQPASTRVTIGTAPDVRTQGKAPAGSKPGDAITIPLTIRNQGLAPADGVSLEIVASPGLTFAEDPACGYSRTDDGQARAVCSWNEKLPPGATAAAVPPLRVRATAFAYDEQLTVQTTSLVSPGPGKPPVADHFASWSGIPVYVASTADFAVTGAALSGTVGSNVKAHVVLTNNGPAQVAATFFAYLNVEVPRGTHTVAADHYCTGFDAKGGRDAEVEDAVRFECLLQPDVSPPGTSNALDFTFHIDKAAVQPGKVGYLLNVSHRPADPVASNDTAPITVTVKSSSSGSPSPSASSPTPIPTATTAAPAAGASGGSGASGGPAATAPPATGDLASTGSAPVALITAVAAATAALGALTVFAARRRRSTRR